MNKEELINLLEGLGLPKKEYYILSSGSLLFYGLREKAGDLDLCVSYELFEVLKERYELKEGDKNSFGFYKISKDIEIVPNSKKDFKLDFVEGYPVEKLETILKFKEKRNEPKDQIDIEKIKEYLKKYPNLRGEYNIEK